MPVGGATRNADLAVEAERRFVLALGGLALEIAGATLVTHERIPAGLFNYVDAREVGVGRQAAFLEKSLDHYFQRALRPTFRLSDPAPAHLDRGLRQLGFRPHTAPLCVLLESSRVTAPPAPKFAVRIAPPEEIDRVVSFWTSERERPELRAALDVAVHHPNPNEEMVPLLASLEGSPVSAAVVFRYRQAAGIHLVTTRPWARGRGAASALVEHIRRARPVAEKVRFSLTTSSERGVAYLREHGFTVGRTYIEYGLSAGAELAIGAPPPPAAPRWRPPRSPPAQPAG